MNKDEVLELIDKYSPLKPGFRDMILSMCPLDFDEASLIAGIKAITFSHQPSSQCDDDEHWVIKSPFNGKYYHFAAFFGAMYPSQPVEITDLPPKDLTELYPSLPS